MTGLRVAERESEYLFRLLDTDRDGLISVEEDLNINIQTKENNAMGATYINSGFSQ